MKVILRDDVDNLGKTGDVVDVADGYARNYLVPQGLAMKASKGALEQAETMRKARDSRDAEARSAAEEVAQKLVPTVIHVTAKAGDEGKLFGSVTNVDLAEAVLAQTGIDLDRRKIELDDAIKTTGSHHAQVRLHPDVVFPLTVEVQAG